jgi:hypothetical protein
MKKILISLISIGMISLFYAAHVSAHSCCGGGMMGYRYYDTKTVETIKGTVVDVGTFPRGGIHVSVKTDRGIVDAHLGPDFFVNEKIKIAKGDAVVVVGSRVKFESKDAIIAKSVEKGGVTVLLRKDDGTPLWSGRGHRMY